MYVYYNLFTLRRLYLLLTFEANHDVYCVAILFFFELVYNIDVVGESNITICVNTFQFIIFICWHLFANSQKKYPCQLSRCCWI